MATTKGPLMSFDASGKLADTVVFSKWKGRNYVRQHVIPANPQTALQVAIRAALRFVTQIYASLSATIKARWQTEADVDSITALNAMVRVNQERTRQNLGWRQDPTLPAGAVEAAPTGVTATAQTRGVALAWTPSAGANDWCTAIYRSTTAGFTASVANLIRIIPRATTAYTDTDVVSGTPYYYRLGGCETGGTLGTLAAEVTATPS